ncbi:MAG TPA: serine hydrolase, partial [Ignavibacteriaceae bacterium]
NQTSRINGYWKADFNDPIENPAQYLAIKNLHNNLTINIDEPNEDWYNIPGERLHFQNDSLHFERFWGLEKYDGIILPGDSVIRGVKLIKNKQLIPFTLRKIANINPNFKVPRSDLKGEPVLKYIYNKPVDYSDHISCGTLEEVGIDSVKIYDLVNRILTRQIPNIHSLLILKDSKLVLEEYFYGYSAGKTHRVHSVTKSITSALFGIAVDKNSGLSIDEPVWKYFTDWDKSKWIMEKYDIKIEHLLSMTAGLDWKGLTLNESNDDIDMYNTDNYFGYLLNRNLRFQPGSNFCYNNGLSLMLGHIIEKASGITADSFAAKYLFNHLKISNYSWDIDKNGITRMDGGLKMRPRDMVRFGLLYLNDGIWNGEQILSENWIKNSTSQKINLNDRGYAYHWWTMDYSIDGKIFRTYYALGHGEQAIIVVPGSKLVFVMTAGNYLQVEQRPFEIMSQYILPSLKTNENSSNVDLAVFKGDYQINQTESINIDLIDNNLIATDPAGLKFRLIRKSSLTFITDDQSRDIQFMTDDNAKVIGV